MRKDNPTIIELAKIAGCSDKTVFTQVQLLKKMIDSI